MRGLFRDVFITGTASGISSLLLKADMSRLMARVEGLSSMNPEQLETLKNELEDRLKAVEQEGREHRELLLKVLKELLAAWLPGRR